MPLTTGLAAAVRAIPDRWTAASELRGVLAAGVDLLHVALTTDHRLPHAMEECAAVYAAWPPRGPSRAGGTLFALGYRHWERQRGPCVMLD